jgi:hypothetical protein
MYPITNPIHPITNPTYYLTVYTRPPKASNWDMLAELRADADFMSNADTVEVNVCVCVCVCVCVMQTS